MNRIYITLILLCLLLTGCTDRECGGCIRRQWLLDQKESKIKLLVEIGEGMTEKNKTVLGWLGTSKDEGRALRWEIDKLCEEINALRAPDPNEVFTGMIRHEMYFDGKWVSLKEEDTKPPLFGIGELPPEYVAMFGDSNGARLDDLQNQEIDKLRANVYGFSHTDKNGLVTTGAGLLERIKKLEAKAVRAVDVSLTETSEVKPLTHILIGTAADDIPPDFPNEVTE